MAESFPASPMGDGSGSLLAALREKATAATARPWRWGEAGATELWAEPTQLIHYRLLDADGRAPLCHAQTWPIRDSEADLIAEAVNRFDALLVVAEAAELVAAYHQAGGDEWWAAHRKLYKALNELGVETPMAESWCGE